MISNQRKTNHPPKLIQKQRSGELAPSYLPTDQDHYLLNLRKNTKKIRDRKATYSLCSVQSKPSLSPAEGSTRFRRRKVQSIASLDPRNIETERPTENIQCQNSIAKIKQSYPLHHVKRTKTIDHCKNVSIEPPDSFCCSPRQQKIKDCIKLMKGVLDDIQNHQTDQQTHRPSRQKIDYHQPQHGTLDYYIKSHAKAHNRKALLLRKGKSNSIIHVLSKGPTHLNHPSKNHPHNLHFDHSNLFDKSVTPKKQLPKEKAQVLKDTNEYQQNIKSIPCSPIRNVNQSSFMSGAGKQSLIRELTQQQQLKQGEKGRRTLKISNKKIKQIFPDGFFEKRI